MNSASVAEMGLYGVVAPLVASAMSAAVIWWPAKGLSATADLNRLDRGDRARIITTGLISIGLVEVVCQAVLRGVPRIPPTEAMHLVPWALVAAAIVGVLELFVPALAGRTISIVAIVILGVILPGLCIAPNMHTSSPLVLWGFHVPGSAPIPAKYEWVGHALLIWTVAWSALKTSAYAAQRSVNMVTLGFYAAGAAAVLGVSGSSAHAQLNAALAFALLGVFAVALLRPRLTLAGPGVCIATALVAATLGQGISLGSTPRSIGYYYGLGVPALVSYIVPLFAPRMKPALRPVFAGVLVAIGAGLFAMWAYQATAATPP